MDYPLLNLLFGLGLIFTLVVNIGLRVLLSKIRLPVWMSGLSWVGLALSLFSAWYIETLFLELMTAAFNRQIGFGLLLIGGIGTLVTASLYSRVGSSRLVPILFGAQMLAVLLSLVITFGLYRSLVSIPGGPTEQSAYLTQTYPTSLVSSTTWGTFSMGNYSSLLSQ